MQRRKAEHEKRLLEEDAKRAAEDPSYKPRFKEGPNPEVTADPNFNLKRRLDEARRKHREQYEEQFEDDLYEGELYPDDFDADEDSYGDEADSIEDGEYERNLDYYYDKDGFAHPKKPKSKFGLDGYPDAYRQQRYHQN